MRIALRFAALVLVACSHRVPQPALSDALILEIHFRETDLVVGREVPIAFELRNTAGAAVEFCQRDGGVSMWFRDTQGHPRPIKLYGLVLDAPCNERTRLNTGEAKSFSDKLAIPFSQDGEIELHANIRVAVPRGVRALPSSDSSIKAKPIRLVVRPANSSAAPDSQPPP